jgi:hypothetical protein
MHLFAVDPGAVHCGWVRWQRLTGEVAEVQHQ